LRSGSKGFSVEGLALWGSQWFWNTPHEHTAYAW